MAGRDNPLEIFDEPSSSSIMPDGSKEKDDSKQLGKGLFDFTDHKIVSIYLCSTPTQNESDQSSLATKQGPVKTSEADEVEVDYVFFHVYVSISLDVPIFMSIKHTVQT